ncbi:MAG: transglutaminase-like domain-containing protein [Bacteroidia bacterium]|jgi:regulator of sirC expression with transglutaminase-like and TPR domain|nr:transglutaminase-like domain-containing protein [Bacteroidia bacterium]
MLNDREVLSLIALLDDDDEEIIRHVESQLLLLGDAAIPLLEQEWGQADRLVHQQRIENMIHQIQFSAQVNALRVWAKENANDLLQGLFIVAKYRYPELSKQTLQNEIDKIRLDVWLEMHYDLSAYEKIRMMNHIFYNVHGFKGNTDQYHDPQNSYINHVLEHKRGNPIMLAVVYMLVAQRLNIPLYGINLPQHFVLGYVDEPTTDLTQLYKPDSVSTTSNGKVLFYVNAFNNGAVFSKANLEQFLKQIQIEPRLEFFEPCSNVDIVKRVLRNLIVAYEKQQRKDKVNDMQQMLSVLGEPPLDHFEDTTPDGEEFD